LGYSLQVTFTTVSAGAFGPSSVNASGAPDFMSFSGSPSSGDYATFDCSNTGCWFIAINLTSGNATVNFETLAENINVNFTAGTTRTVYVNFDTGAISVDDGGSGAGCS
jgi:hypothetical protein